jgi:hypothetical protein
MASDGVVSTGALTAGIVWVGQPGDYATFNSHQSRYAIQACRLVQCSNSAAI